jgi:hypothetical protein
MGNLGEELEETPEAQAPTDLPEENFEKVELTQEQLKEMFIQQDPEGWAAAQLKMRYLDALGRKMSGQRRGVTQSGQARQVISSNSRAARRMFKRKSGKD